MRATFSRLVDKCLLHLGGQGRSVETVENDSAPLSGNVHSPRTGGTAGACISILPGGATPFRVGEYQRREFSLSAPAARRIDSLTKSFGWRPGKRVQAVEDLSLEVAAGQVYGFLGPNGAGKTTTIRMLLDLIRPDQGDVFLFGRHIRRERTVLRRVGSLVEGASFYDFLTGRRNLEVLALTSNLDLPAAQFDAVLDLVDMREASRRRVRGYSTGMKQRLGIAAAMLADPDLVILDEPANGLHPYGINEVRALARRLVDEFGKTVFLSSHQLGEVEQVCDRVAIIHHGRLLREGSVAELVSEKSRLRIEAEPVEQTLAVLARRGATVTEDGTALLIEAKRTEVPLIVEELVHHGIRVYAVSAQRQSLENYFLSVTKGQDAVSYTHLRAHETKANLVCRLL